MDDDLLIVDDSMEAVPNSSASDINSDSERDSEPECNDNLEIWDIEEQEVNVDLQCYESEKSDPTQFVALTSECVIVYTHKVIYEYHRVCIDNTRRWGADLSYGKPLDLCSQGSDVRGLHNNHDDII